MTKPFQLIVFAMLFTLQTACSSGGSSTDNATTDSEQPSNDTTITGEIQKMWYLVYQGQIDYGLTLDNGRELTIKSGRGGQIGDDGQAPFNVYVNDEAKDILFTEKESADRINTKYLHKKVKVTFDKVSNIISKLEVTGESPIPSATPRTITATISEMTQDKLKRKALSFVADNETISLIFFTDKDNHYSLSSIYNGRNNKADCVFETKHYSLSLTPEATQRPVAITITHNLTQYKEVDHSQGSQTWFFYEDVITDVVYSDSEQPVDIEMGGETVD